MASMALRPPRWLCGISRVSLPIRRQSPILSFLAPFTAIQHASSSSKTKSKASKAKATKTEVSKKKKKKSRTQFIRGDLKLTEQWALCDVMRFIRAFEVGRDPRSSKYELAVSLKTIKNAPIVRNRLRLPHSVDTSQRICVICPPDSAVAVAAVKAGATLVGEEDVFDVVRTGKIEFERCICHVDSKAKFLAANLGRYLGPKGLMPSPKTKTIVRDVPAAIRSLVGGSEYKEKLGVVRLAIGQLAFTPEQLQANIRAFVAALRDDLAQLSENVHKEIHEVVGDARNGAFC